MPASADNIDVSPSLKISQCVFVLSMLDENNWAFKKGTNMARNSKRLTMHSWIQVEIFRGNRNQHISPIHSWLLETTISQDGEDRFSWTICTRTWRVQKLLKICIIWEFKGQGVTCYWCLYYCNRIWENSCHWQLMKPLGYLSLVFYSLLNSFCLETVVASMSF